MSVLSGSGFHGCKPQRSIRRLTEWVRLHEVEPISSDDNANHEGNSAANGFTKAAAKPKQSMAYPPLLDARLHIVQGMEGRPSISQRCPRFAERKAPARVDWIER